MNLKQAETLARLGREDNPRPDLPVWVNPVIPEDEGTVLNDLTVFRIKFFTATGVYAMNNDGEVIHSYAEQRR